jgi:hypothetical protein
MLTAPVSASAKVRDEIRFILDRQSEDDRT